MPKSRDSRGSATKAPYDSPNSRGQEDDVPEFALGCDFDGKGGPEPDYEGEEKDEDEVHYIPEPPPEWLKEDEPEDSLTKRLQKAFEAAEKIFNDADAFNCFRELKVLHDARTKRDMHKLYRNVEARMVEVSNAAEDGKCCICLRGDANHDDFSYCKDCEHHIQNVPKHSPHRKWFDVSPIAWDEWWVPRNLWNGLMAHLMLTSEGKLKQDLEF